MKIHCNAQGRPVLLGAPQFQHRSLFGLEVGQQVVQIGELARSGKQTSSCRITTFTRPATYAGLFRGEGGTKDTLYAAFLLHPSTIKGWNLFCPPQPYFELWAVSEEARELLLQDLIGLTIEIHRGVFTLAEPPAGTEG